MYLFFFRIFPCWSFSLVYSAVCPFYTFFVRNFKLTLSLHFLAPVSILALWYSPLYNLYGTSRDTNFHILTGYLRRFIVVNNGKKPGVSRCKQNGWSRMLWLQRLRLQRTHSQLWRLGLRLWPGCPHPCSGADATCSVSGFASPGWSLTGT